MESSPTPTPKSTDAFFAPALDMVPEITACLSQPSLKRDQQLAQAQALIETKLIAGNDDAAQRYLGCLIIGQLSSMRQGGDALTQELTNFIQGNYEVRGESFAGGSYKPNANNTRLTPPVGDGLPVITINQGNHLALAQICEAELEKTCGNSEVAKRLAASTMRLGADAIPSNYTTVPGERFCKAVKAHDCNPYKDTRILEFAGFTNNLSDTKQQQKLLLLSLIGGYQDYTPVFDPIARDSDANSVTLENPTAFFTSLAKAKENEKFPYIIASNVFCHGAYGSKQDNVLFKDLLPHLANSLCDGGKLIISNVTNDGMYMFDEKREPNLPVPAQTLGLKLAAPLKPLTHVREDTTESGIYIVQRDYALRPPVPYTADEHRMGASDTPASSHFTQATQARQQENNQGRT